MAHIHDFTVSELTAAKEGSVCLVEYIGIGCSLLKRVLR